MTDPESNKDLELDLELEPELELQPEDSSADSSPSTADESAGVEGQWVWQYAAPPPPPSFLAVFFSGTAHKELYRFFACSLLVVIGCLLPWGPVTVEGLPDAEGVTVETVLPMPDVMGYETPAGAISLMLGLWLMLSSCYGIYTRRQKILPVFLMIEPAAVSLLRTLDAWEKLESESALDKLVELFEVAGSGVMLTLIGSGFVALGFLFLIVKVYTKKDDKGSGRRPPREKDSKKGGGKSKASGRKGKAGKKAGAADEEAASTAADGSSAAEGSDAGDAAAAGDSPATEAASAETAAGAEGAGDKPAAPSSRRSRGRRR